MIKACTSHASLIAPHIYSASVFCTSRGTTKSILESRQTKHVCPLRAFRIKLWRQDQPSFCATTILSRMRAFACSLILLLLPPRFTKPISPFRQPLLSLKVKKELHRKKWQVMIRALHPPVKEYSSGIRKRLYWSCWLFNLDIGSEFHVLSSERAHSHIRYIDVILYH